MKSINIKQQQIENLMILSSYNDDILPMSFSELDLLKLLKPKFSPFISLKFHLEKVIDNPFNMIPIASKKPDKRSLRLATNAVSNNSSPKLTVATPIFLSSHSCYFSHYYRACSSFSPTFHLQK